MSQSMINTFISSAIGLVVLMLGFFANKWIASLSGSLDKLDITIDKLNLMISAVDRRVDGHDRDLDEHGVAIAYLHKTRCTAHDCPNRDDVDPVTSPFLMRGENRG